MMNNILKKAYDSKKYILFFATKDLKKKSNFGNSLLINVINKNYNTTATEYLDDLEYHPTNYTYESIQTILEGKDFTKNFNAVFKAEIDELKSSDKKFSNLLEKTNFSNINYEISDTDIKKKFVIYLQSIKNMHKRLIEYNKDKNLNNNNNIISEEEKANIISSLNNSYNPFINMDKSSQIENIQYDKLNIFKYFLNYGNFIKGLNVVSKEEIETKHSNNNTVNNDKVLNYMNSLCMIFIGNNIHQRILDEISRRTNIFILKGDYFFSLGYNTISSLGNPFLIRLYSKINENFAKSIFFKANFKVIENKSAFYSKLLDYLVRKNIGFYYLGCLGLSELYNKKYFSAYKELVKEFSFKYGVLLYLREELAFLKDKSMEFYAKSEELAYSLFIHSEKIMNELCFDNSDRYIKHLNKSLSNKNELEKYNYFAISICSDLFALIDKMSALAINGENTELKTNEMKDFLKMVFLDIEEMIRI